MRVLFFLLMAITSVAKSQQLSLDTVKAPAAFENIYARKIAGDSLSTTFVIFIKKEVKKHRHASHTENILVLEGEGEMLMGDNKFRVKKGDYVFIPQNTPHAVKVISKKPLKVVSVQSPYFDGSDRIILE